MTVPHKFGETTIEAEPERVVSVGYTEHDVLLQLGVVPVGVTDWYGDQPFATWPWAQELLGDAEPEVLSLTDGFEYEKIAALEPDLIIGTNAGMTEKDYELLSAIAPTVTSVEGSTQYFSSWSDQTLQIARAFGREADGQQLIDDVDAAHAEVAAEHPEYAELSAVFSQGGPYDGILYVYPDGLSTDFLTDLGFQYLQGLEEYAPEAGSQAEISAENVDLIEADVVVFATESQEHVRRAPGLGHDLAAPGGHGEPRGLHRRDARRGDLLRHAAQPGVRPGAAGADDRARLEGRGAARVPVVSLLQSTSRPENGRVTDYNDIPVEDDGIKLGQFLKLADLVESGAQAKQVLAGGVVRVNGDVETRRGRQLERGDVVSLGANSARVGGERDW